MTEQRRNVFAWTPAGSAMPAYVSLNSVPGGYELIVRSGPEAGSMCAWVALGREQLLAMRDALTLELGDGPSVDPLAWPFGPRQAQNRPNSVHVDSDVHKA
jgi:hypothetical protein